MRRQIDTDREIAAIAGRQYGVVGRSQLLALSLSAPSVDRRVQRGRLHVVHRGVYAVGHTVLTVEGRWMAATLATGGVLSHATAAAAWDLRPSASRTVHVTVAGAARRRAGVCVHRTRTLEATTYRGIPITTPLRTIIDLATTLKGRPPPDPAPLTSGVVPLPRNDPHKKRARGALPRALRQPRPTPAANQHGHRGHRGRLRLARPTTRRRGRRLRLPPLADGLRDRPRPRCHPDGGRLARPALHLGADHGPQWMGGSRNLVHSGR
jgi:Transcriptional regulator, AbiEi antitoxin